MSYDLFSIHDYSTCFMIKIKCANDTIIELLDLHKSFDSSIVVFDGSTTLRMRAQYSHLSHGYDDGIPGRPIWDTTLFSAVARDIRGSQQKRPWSRNIPIGYIG